jgi:hypothetical protein
MIGCTWRFRPTNYAPTHESNLNSVQQTTVFYSTYNVTVFESFCCHMPILFPCKDQPLYTIKVDRWAFRNYWKVSCTSEEMFIGVLFWCLLPADTDRVTCFVYGWILQPSQISSINSPMNLFDLYGNLIAVPRV